MKAKHLEKFPINSRVKHKNYGVGTVLNHHNYGRGKHSVQVQFDTPYNSSAGIIEKWYEWRFTYLLPLRTNTSHN